MVCDTTRFPPVPAAPEPDTTKSGLSRRTALRVGSGGALALVIGGIAGWVDRRGDDATPAAVDTDGFSPNTTLTTSAPPTTTTTRTPVAIAEIGEVDAGIVALGRRVLETTDETDLDTLLAQLPSGAGDPLERAATQVREDFLGGRTIMVDGWVLAASEARAAAVVALLCDASSC